MNKKMNVFDQLIQNEINEKENKSDTWIKQNIKIKEEFQKLIPPLTEEESGKLEQSILEEGCRDPLVVWEGTGVLVDGHNRYAICEKHGVDFEVVLKDFAGIQDVQDWMIDNQLGKRNATEETKSYLRGLQYRREKKNVGARTGNKNAKKQIGQNDPIVLSTSERLARQHKVSEKTIKRDERYAEAVDRLAQDDTDLKWKILHKEIDIPKGALIDLGKEEDEAKLEEIKKGLMARKAFKKVIKELETSSSGKAIKELNPREQLEKEKKKFRLLLKKLLELGMSIEDIQVIFDELKQGI